MALYSNYAFRRLNTRVSVFSFYEAATDPIFQPLDLFEFSLQFGCGSQLELRDDFVCVEIYAHEGNPGVKFAGFYRSILLLRERISDTDYRVPERRQAGSSKGSSDLASLAGVIDGSMPSLPRSSSTRCGRVYLQYGLQRGLPRSGKTLQRQSCRG